MLHACKSIFIALALLCVTVQPAASADLCDASCDLAINFTDGGSIEAIEAVTLQFGIGGSLVLGNGGTINIAVPPASLDYSSGGSLMLVAGESITFGDGGELNLGFNGNIDSTNINITVLGDLMITATGGSSTITFQSGVLSAGNLTLNSDVSIENDLHISSGTTLIGNGTVDIGVSGTLTTGGGTILTSAAGSLSLSAINSSSTTISIGGLTTVQLTQDLLVTLEGVTLDTSDGGTCTVTEGECVTSTGAKYIVVDGELVLADDGSGAINLIDTFVLFVLLLAVRNHNFLRIRKCWMLSNNR